jgi:hypothetical protein
MLAFVVIVFFCSFSIKDLQIYNLYMHMRYIAAESVSKLVHPSSVLYLQSCRSGSQLLYEQLKPSTRQIGSGVRAQNNP